MGRVCSLEAGIVPSDTNVVMVVDLEVSIRLQLQMDVPSEDSQ